MSHQACKTKYDELDIPVTKNMLCADSIQAPCKGDSGSPMVILESGTSDRYNQVIVFNALYYNCLEKSQFKNITKIFHQIGIISHGQGCATEDFPTIYSKVSLFLDWIQENTPDTVYCQGTF